MTDPAIVGAGDQLEAIARSLATEFARFYTTLLERGIPAALAKQLTLRHQFYRYGWTGEDE